MSFIASNRKELEITHYVRSATSENHWFDFSNKVVESYLASFGRDFCMIVNGSESEDDAYVLPYRIISEVLTEEGLDKRGRWVGTIWKDVLRIHLTGKSIVVSDFYNRFDLLDSQALNETPEPVFSSNTKEGLSREQLSLYISDINKKFSSASPQKLVSISERIARPGALSRLVKQLQGYRCQLCGVHGFQMKNGSTYAEAHHLIELHRLVPGSLCSDNIVVVCAGCHRMLHYASKEIRNAQSTSFEIKLADGPWRKVDRNILSTTQ